MGRTYEEGELGLKVGQYNSLSGAAQCSSGVTFGTKNKEQPNSHQVLKYYHTPCCQKALDYY